MIFISSSDPMIFPFYPSLSLLCLVQFSQVSHRQNVTGLNGKTFPCQTNVETRVDDFHRKKRVALYVAGTIETGRIGCCSYPYYDLSISPFYPYYRWFYPQISHTVGRMIRMQLFVYVEVPKIGVLPNSSSSDLSSIDR